VNFWLCGIGMNVVSCRYGRNVPSNAEDWLYHYNNERPNMGNGSFTPIQKLNHAA